MDNELYHHGIIGMKWGIRRYQNKDGSLTPRGQKRYNKEMDKLKEEARVLKNREATKKKLDKLEAKRLSNEARKKALEEDDESKKTGDPKAKTGKKSVKDMTDEELFKAVERSRLENQYKQLNPDPPVKQSFAKKFVNEAAVPALVNAGRTALQNFIQNKANEMMKGKVDPNSLEGMKAIKDKLQTEYDIKSLREKINGKQDVNMDAVTKQWDLDKKIRDERARERGFKDAADEIYQTSRANNSNSDSNSNKNSNQSNNNGSDKSSNKNSNQSNNPVNKTNVNSGKKAVNNVKDTSVDNVKSPTNKEWAEFKAKYSWGVEPYAKDEV